jgi:hypothetical protein
MHTDRRNPSSPTILPIDLLPAARGRQEGRDCKFSAGLFRRGMVGDICRLRHTNCGTRCKHDDA